MNPLNKMNTTNLNNINDIKSMYNQFKNIQNPMMFLQNDPRYRDIMKMCNGRNPKDVFYQICQERGIDPNSIFSQMK